MVGFLAGTQECSNAEVEGHRSQSWVLRAAWFPPTASSLHLAEMGLEARAPPPAGLGSSLALILFLITACAKSLQ